MTLARKMALMIASVALVGGVVLLLVITVLIQGPSKKAAIDRELAQATNLMAGIDRSLGERSKDVQSISHDTALVGLADRPTLPATIAGASNYLERIAKTEDSWQGFDIIGSDARVIASSSAARVGDTVSQQSLLKDALAAGQATYQDPYNDASLRAAVMPFAATLQPATGKSKLVLVGYLKWQQFVGVLETVESDSVRLHNRSGLVLGDKGAQATLKDVETSAALQAAFIGTESAIVETNRAGVEAVVAYVGEEGYEGYKGLGWALATEVPAAQAFAGTRDITLKVVAALVIVLALGATCATLLVIQVVKPVGQLTAITQKIASGDLSQRIVLKSRNEYGRLADAFNSMTDRLQQVYEGLERRVAEKTAQLAQKVDEVEAEKVKDEALLSSIGEGMIAIDADGLVARINHPATLIIGIAEAALLGKPINQAVKFLGERGQDMPAEAQPGFLALHHGQKTEDTYQISRADNPKAAITIVSSPIRLQHRTIGVIMVIRDVTREREVDRMKTEFISLASHQLRTPLSAIRWFSEMLLSGDAGELSNDQKEFASNIAESTDRMIQLVSSLLNISRIESGRIIIDPRPTDMKELVNGIVSDLHAKIEERDQHLAISVHDGLDKINLDPRMIGQVYLNLLTNAIKYTPKGGDITVIISRSDDRIISQVTDNGYGIPKAQQDKMFQKFFRADNVAKIETDGTGLGMYLVKAIVESSGGKIWFESEEGKGTTFWFSLPAAGMKARAGEVSLDG